jgi:formylglycine-generating enzyme required for sulfatase activity
MLTGEKPIAATDRNLEAIQPPHALNNKVSEQISSAVMLAMELKPENRFQSVAEMREVIQSLRQINQKTERTIGENKKDLYDEFAMVLDYSRSLSSDEQVEIFTKFHDPDKTSNSSIPSKKNNTFAESGKNKNRENRILKLLLVLAGILFGLWIIYHLITPPNNKQSNTNSQNIETQEAKDLEVVIEQAPQETDPTEAEIGLARREELERQGHGGEREKREEEEGQQRPRETEEQKEREQAQNIASVIQQLQNNLVYVDGGTFVMGCTAEQGSNCGIAEKPTHQVTLSSFYISKYEVTHAQWRAVMGNDPGYHSSCNNCPVEQVSWNDVQEFIRKLNQLISKKYRLPTEAEWEYAARGGRNSKGYKYSGSNNNEDVAWCKYNSWIYHPHNWQTHPVGQKQPNELGLYDMSGNVEEWCSDYWGKYNSYAQNNPKGPYSGKFHLFRGGSFLHDTSWSRISFRNSQYDNNGERWRGFRLVSD